MPITLAEAKVGMADKVDQTVIDEYRRSSMLLDMLIFDNAVSPGTGGSTLVYGYIKLLSPSTVTTRKINEEYTPGEAKREEKTSKIIPFGGTFQVDRILQGTSGAVDEISFQMQQKIKASGNYFHNLVINGTSASTGTGYVVNTFDGLKKTLSGSDTEYTSTVDISTSELLDTNYNAFLDEFDSFLSVLDGKPTLLMMNGKMLNKVRSVARRAGYYERTKNDFGQYVEMYNGIPLMDTGSYWNGTKTVDVIEVTTPSASAYGETDIYAVNIAMDGFHGISPQGDKIVKTFLPDMEAPGAVKTGEVEMLAGVVLKNSKKGAVLKGIKITPKTGA